MQGVRTVIISIDALVELLRDYTSNLHDIPEDAKAVKLYLNKAEANKIAIEVDSDQWAHGMAPLVLHFDIKRLHGVS